MGNHVDNLYAFVKLFCDRLPADMRVLIDDEEIFLSTERTIVRFIYGIRGKAERVRTWETLGFIETFATD